MRAPGREGGWLLWLAVRNAARLYCESTCASKQVAPFTIGWRWPNAHLVETVKLEQSTYVVFRLLPSVATVVRKAQESARICGEIQKFLFVLASLLCLAVIPFACSGM